MRKVFCDLCGDHMPANEEAYSVLVSGFGRPADSIPTQVVFSATEICRGCETSIVSFIHDLMSEGKLPE